MFVNGKELMEMKLEGAGFIVEQLVPEVGITYFTAKSGRGKTFVSVFLCLSVLTGGKFMGLFETKKGNVLFIDEENGEVVIQQRLRLINEAVPIEELPNIHFKIMENFTLDSESISKIKKIVEEKKINLIIIDCLSRVFLGDENSSKETRRIYALLKKLCHENKLAVIILHHSRKSENEEIGEEDMRGSSELSAAAVSVLLMDKSNKYGCLIMKQTKLRIGMPLQDQIFFELKFSEDKTQCALNFLRRGKVRRSASEKATEVIRRIIKNEKPEEMVTVEMKERLKDIFKSNAVNNAFQTLEMHGEIDYVKKGHWRVIYPP